MSWSSMFTRFSQWSARQAGHPSAFVLALAVTLAWAVTGPAFGFSTTWQLVINSITNVATFLMVFLIQNTQNRESEASQIKLDEVIRALPGASKALLDLEELSERDLDRFRDQYEALARRAREEIGASDQRP